MCNMFLIYFILTSKIGKVKKKQGILIKEVKKNGRKIGTDCLHL